VEHCVDLPYMPADCGKWFFLEHGTLHFVLTLLMGDMLDIARFGLPGGKLRL